MMEQCTSPDPLPLERLLETIDQTGSGLDDAQYRLLDQTLKNTPYHDIRTYYNAPYEELEQEWNTRITSSEILVKHAEIHGYDTQPHLRNLVADLSGLRIDQYNKSLRLEDPAIARKGLTTARRICDIIKTHDDTFRSYATHELLTSSMTMIALLEQEQTGKFDAEEYVERVIGLLQEEGITEEGDIEHASKSSFTLAGNLAQFDAPPKDIQRAIMLFKAVLILGVSKHDKRHDLPGAPSTEERIRQTIDRLESRPGR